MTKSSASDYEFIWNLIDFYHCERNNEKLNILVPKFFSITKTSCHCYYLYEYLSFFAWEMNVSKLGKNTPENFSISFTCEHQARHVKRYQ